MEINSNIEYIERCKCCLEIVGLKNMWSAYNRDDETEIYGQMLNNCYVLDWEQPPLDDYSEHICEVCISRLHNAVSFKKEILLSQQLLQKEQLRYEPFDEVKQEEESDTDIETEYLSIECFEDDDNKRERKEIKMETRNKPIKEELLLNQRIKKYTDDDLQKCVEAVLNKTISQNKASILYNIPRKAISMAVSRKQRRNSNDDLTTVIEKESYQAGDFQKKGNLLLEHGENIASILVYTNATPIREHNYFGYACSFCPEVYKNPANLKLHSLGHEYSDKKNFITGKNKSDYLINLDITELYCKICKITMETLDEMLSHLEDHGKTINMDIKNHIVPFKFGGKHFTCVNSACNFNNFKKLQQHMNCDYTNYICDVCDLGFINRTYLSNHYERHKNGTSCNFCAIIFENQKKKRSHELKVHVNLKKCKCKHCGEEFTSNRKKERHIANFHRVSEKNIKCQTCEKICFTENRLRVHIRRNHLIDKKYTSSY